MENYSRNCPICNKEIVYKTKQSYRVAHNNNAKCKQCSAKISNNTPERKLQLKLQMTGKNNPMYGKSFKECWKEKYDEDTIKKLEKNHSEKSSKGAANAMKGRTVYNIWVSKYGKDEADRRLLITKSKLSQAFSGENNPMYGKPAPKKAGNGWSGYFKGHYFRSILELSYLVYLIDNNINFESGEHKKYKIEYEIDCQIKNYFPDFYLIDTDTTIELKPNALINTRINKIKFDAGKHKYGDNFKVLTEMDIDKINIHDLMSYYINKDIIWDKNYEEKFINYIKQKGGTNEPTPNDSY